MTALSVNLFGEDVTAGHGSRLAETFEYPPFSVWNAREGWWQERKRAWLALGIESELGRGGAAAAPGGGLSDTISRLKPSAQMGGGRHLVAPLCPPLTTATASAATGAGAI